MSELHDIEVGDSLLIAGFQLHPPTGKSTTSGLVRTKNYTFRRDGRLILGETEESDSASGNSD